MQKENWSICSKSGNKNDFNDWMNENKNTIVCTGNDSFGRWWHTEFNSYRQTLLKRKSNLICVWFFGMKFFEWVYERKSAWFVPSIQMKSHLIRLKSHFRTLINIKLFYDNSKVCIFPYLNRCLHHVLPVAGSNAQEMRNAKISISFSIMSVNKQPLDGNKTQHLQMNEFRSPQMNLYFL